MSGAVTGAVASLDESAVERLKRHTGFVPAKRTLTLRGKEQRYDAIMRDLQNLRLTPEVSLLNEGVTIPADAGADLVSEAAYLRKGYGLISAALQYPFELTDSTAKQQLVNGLAEFMKVAGTLAVNLATARAYLASGTNTTEERLIGKGTYAATGFLLDMVLPDVVSMATRKLGGVDTKIYLNPRAGRSNVGAYNEIFGRGMVGAIQLLIYGLTTTGIYGDYQEDGEAPGLKGTVSAVLPAIFVAAVATQLLNFFLVRSTLKKQRVESHADLRPQQDNHDPGAGRITALNQQIPAVRDRAMWKDKAHELKWQSLSSIMKQSAIFSMQAAANHINPAMSPAAYQAFTVFLSFPAGLIAQLGGNAIAAHYRNDPLRNRQFQTSLLNQVRSEQLKLSSLNLRTAALNEVANSLSGTDPGRNFFNTDEAYAEHLRIRGLFSDACKVFRADAAANFRAHGDIDAVRSLKAFFEQQRDEYRAHARNVSDISKGNITHAYELLTLIDVDLGRLEDILDPPVAADGSATRQAPEPILPNITDMVQKLRALSIQIFQGDYLKVQGDALRQEDARLMQNLVPVLAGQRMLDRREKATAGVKALESAGKLFANQEDKLNFLESITSNHIPGLPTSDVVRCVNGVVDGLTGRGKFKPDDSDLFKHRAEFFRFFGNDMLSVIDEGIARCATPAARNDYIRRMIDGLYTTMEISDRLGLGSPSTKATLSVLKGQLQQRLSPAVVQPGAEVDAIIRFLPEDGNLAQADGALDDLLQELAAGHIDVDRLSLLINKPGALPRQNAAPGQSEQAALSDHVDRLARLRPAVRAMEENLDIGTLLALQGDKGGADGRNDFGRRFLDVQALDIENMHRVPQAMEKVGFLLGRIEGARELEAFYQNDGHFHPNNNNKRRAASRNMVKVAEASAIVSSASQNMPFATQDPTPEIVYYGNNYGKKWTYAFAEEDLKREVSGPNIVTSTAINLQEPKHIETDLDTILRNDPLDTIKAIGEITLKKFGGISDASAIELITIDKVARLLLVPLARRGLPCTIHHDFGGSHEDYKLGKLLMKAIKEAARILEEEADPLAAGAPPGTVPPPRLSINIAHMGMAPANSGGPNLSRFLVEMLQDPVISKFVIFDVSWSVVWQYVVSKCRDDIALLSKDMALAMDCWMTSYKAFQKQGNTGDKNTDLNLPDEAAMHDAATAGYTDFHTRVLAFGSRATRSELQDPHISGEILKRCLEHGDSGNNFFYLFAQMTKERRDAGRVGPFMFGTDNLASEIKIQGQAEHMLDAFSSFLTYVIFDELGKEGQTAADGSLLPRDAALADVVPDMARLTYDDHFNNPADRARRDAHRTYLQTVKTSDGRRAYGNVLKYIDGRFVAEPSAAVLGRMRDWFRRMAQSNDVDELEQNFPGEASMVAYMALLTDVLERSSPVTAGPSGGATLADDPMILQTTAVFAQFMDELKVANRAAFSQLPQDDEERAQGLNLCEQFTERLVAAIGGTGAGEEFLERLIKGRLAPPQLSKLRMAFLAARDAVSRPVRIEAA